MIPKLIVLVLLASAPTGLAQINTRLARIEGLIARYNDLAPNLLNSETGLDGATVLRGGEGATGIVGWADTPAASLRGMGATNIGF